jgi:hypothetical protein
MSETASDLRSNINGMFAIKESANKGYEYAMSVLQAEGVSGVAATTALLVYSNSLLNHLAKDTARHDYELTLALDCLINTVEQSTDLDTVYCDDLDRGMDMDDIKELRERLESYS